MKAYKIAQFLTDDEKRRACQADYSGPPDGPHAGKWEWAPYCPLGFIVAADVGWPSPATVAIRLAALGRGEQVAIQRAARIFIDQWDQHAITAADLPRVLGVQP